MLANKSIFKIRVFLWAVLFTVVAWLLYMGIVPSGKISYVYNLKKENYFINKLTPKERIETVSKGSQKIIGNPVYFALRTPRRFNKAKLTLKYKNNSDLPLIEAGVLVDKRIWRYDLKPIENKVLDQLIDAWDVIQEEGIVLLQRERKYQSINDFLNNLPRTQNALTVRSGMNGIFREAKMPNAPSVSSWARGFPLQNEIAIYNYELKDKFILPNYQPKSDENQIDYALRGPWQIYAYVKNEDLDFSFLFRDLNKNKDTDSIDLNLYFNNQLIDSRHLDDDGIIADNGEETPRGELRLKLSGLPEGIYKIELRVNDDIVTKSIVTTQQRFSFINKIWLAWDNKKDIVLYSDSGVINAQTINPASLQTIRVDEKELKIDKTYRQFSVSRDSDMDEIKLEKDDIILSGNGVFSFSKEGFINPEFKKADGSLYIDKSNINYIIARYEKPADENRWRVASAEFDLTQAYREFEPRLLGRSARVSDTTKHSFLISIPNLNVEDDINDSIEVGEIRIDLEGMSLWQKITKIIKKQIYTLIYDRK